MAGKRKPPGDAIPLRNEQQTFDVRLDRIAEPGAQNKPVMAVIGGQLEPVTINWGIPEGEPVLNQGKEGACVGFGVTNELRFNPVPIMGLDERFAREQIYWPAQHIDDWEGGSYSGANPFYEGTSVRAGLEAAQELGYVGEYRAANNEYEMALAMTLGPVIIGVDWYEGMFRPDKRGYIKPTGAKMGGHCCLVIGLKVTRGPSGSGYYTIYNSWGPTWGDKGTAKIRRVDMARLLDDGGDAFSITSRYNPPQPR
jgi:hypothetical protein